MEIILSLIKESGKRLFMLCIYSLVKAKIGIRLVNFFHRRFRHWLRLFVKRLRK